MESEAELTMLRESTVAERLGLGPDYADWLASLEELGAPEEGLPLPEANAASPLIDELEIDEADRNELLADWPSQHKAPEVWWLLERAYHGVRRDVGHTDAIRPMPNVPKSLPVVGQRFWIYVFLAAVDDVRQWHRAQGISEIVSRDTLADLGRHMRLFRQRNGHTGLDTHWWIAIHFRGGLFAIGRLQYTPYPLLTGLGGPLFWYDDQTATRLGKGLRRGDPAIGIHIPEAGPLTPQACTQSFLDAHAFFQRHFPEYADAVGTCTSWLMDDQLLEYLEPDSNIVQFQRRFELVPGARDSDSSAFHFVFGRSPEAIDELSPNTTLERAIVNHVKGGGHWRMRTGWLRLGDQARG